MFSTALEWKHFVIDCYQTRHAIIYYNFKMCFDITMQRPIMNYFYLENYLRYSFKLFIFYRNSSTRHKKKYLWILLINKIPNSKQNTDKSYRNHYTLVELRLYESENESRLYGLRWIGIPNLTLVRT